MLTVNGASFRADQGVAPGSIAGAFGTFSQTPDQVTVNGVAGKLFGASTSQVNFLVPAAISSGAATISVRAGGLELGNGQATATPTGPGLFVLQSADPSQPGAVEHAVVPSGLTGQVPVFVAAGGLTSNAVTVWIH